MHHLQYWKVLEANRGTDIGLYWKVVAVVVVELSFLQGDLPKLKLPHWHRQVRLPNIKITLLSDALTNVLCCFLNVFEGL